MALKCFNSELEKNAISAGLVGRAMAKRIGRTVFASPERTNLMKGFMAYEAPASRAAPWMRKQVAGVQTVAPKGSRMTAGEYGTRATAQEAGYPMGKAPVHATAPSTPAATPQSNIGHQIARPFKWFGSNVAAPVGRGLAMGGVLGGAAILGGASSAFAANPYETQPAY